MKHAKIWKFGIFALLSLFPPPQKSLFYVLTKIKLIMTSILQKIWFPPGSVDLGNCKGENLSTYYQKLSETIN
jgi:hypothetical protein